MKSQWECLLENLGQWQGSFTRFSPQGELLEDIPTIVSLEGLDSNQKIRQIVQHFLPSGERQEKVLEYNTLGRNILFFENGAFSQGSMQLGPFSEFGAELGLIDASRRVRLVQMFDKESNFQKLTLIRETLAGEDNWKTGRLMKVEDLLGEWQGKAVTIYPDFRSPDTYATKLQLSLDQDGRLVQSLNFGQRTISSRAKIDDSILYFEEGLQPIQVLLLPDGASCACPLKLNLGQSFFLELGWLLSVNFRQRLIRSYNNKGEWISLTLVKEWKV